MTILVRVATAADAHAVATIYVESWNEGFGHLLGSKSPGAGDSARWEATLSSADERWWVAERSHGVVGFVGIGDSREPVQDGRGELDTIAVAPASWRMGVGRALIDTAVAGLREQYRDAILWTVAGYDRGHRFYEAMGWRLDGGVRADGTEVRFRRALNHE